MLLNYDQSHPMPKFVMLIEIPDPEMILSVRCSIWGWDIRFVRLIKFRSVSAVGQI